MANIKRVYWDACCWIAYIKQEVVDVNGKRENRYEMCRQTLLEADKGAVEIVTSAFTLAEVCKSSEVKDSPVDHLPSFFDKSYILLVPVDKNVGLRAQSLQLAGLVGLKPPDTVHVASAIIAKCEELHTFDRRILNHNKRITGKDGEPMTICKPTQQVSAGPLLEALEKEASA
jgi:predicted nucleic acid-binding protein